MLESRDDEGLAHGLLAAFAWAAADLAALGSEQAIVTAVLEVLHWEGTDALLLLPEGDGLVLAALRASPERSRALAAGRFDCAARGRLLLSRGEPRRGRWDDVSGSAPGGWVAFPLAGKGSLLVVEGTRLGPLSAEILGRFAAHAGALIQQRREAARLALLLEEQRRLHRTIVAEERLTVLGEAAAVLAHEMRNPLGSISNAVALLRRSPQTDPVPLGIIQDETDRLESLARDLLQLARPLEPQLRRVDLEALVHATLDRVQGGFNRRDITFCVSSAPQPVLISADPALLGLALENLLRNATQVTPPRGEVQVTVGIGPGGASLAVEDQGPGVALADRSRIFEPFFTTHAVGTGLGLPIVKRLVEAHGGTVRVDSSPRGGAMFELLLGRG